jgi:hypothetical protein
MVETKLNLNHQCYKGTVMMVIIIRYRRTVRIRIRISVMFDGGD